MTKTATYKNITLDHKEELLDAIVPVYTILATELAAMENEPDEADVADLDEQERRAALGQLDGAEFRAHIDGIIQANVEHNPDAPKGVVYSESIGDTIIALQECCFSLVFAGLDDPETVRETISERYGVEVTKEDVDDRLHRLQAAIFNLAQVMRRVDEEAESIVMLADDDEDSKE